MDHSNLFHAALTKVHDIAKNGCRNTQAWHDVLEVADGALGEARRQEAEVQRKWPRSNVHECPNCKRMFKDGETCSMSGCPMGGDF